MDMARFLVVLDVDSTLIENEVIELLAEAAGTRQQVAEMTTAAMLGSVDFEESLRARVATLKGLSEQAVNDAVGKVRITAGVEKLIHGIHSVGGRVGAISGGFHEVLDPIASFLDLDRWRACCLESSDGVLTGRVRGRIVDPQAKADAVLDWAEIYGVPRERTVVIGDGANDLLMMKCGGLSIAFDAVPAVRAAANLILDDRDLSLVLPLLGLEN